MHHQQAAATSRTHVHTSNSLIALWTTCTPSMHEICQLHVSSSSTTSESLLHIYDSHASVLLMLSCHQVTDLQVDPSNRQATAHASSAYVQAAAAVKPLSLLSACTHNISCCLAHPTAACRVYLIYKYIDKYYIHHIYPHPSLIKHGMTRPGTS